MSKSWFLIVGGCLVSAASALVFYGGITEALDVPGRGRGFAHMLALWFFLGVLMVQRGLALHSERAEKLGCWTAIALVLVAAGLFLWYAPGIASWILGGLVLLVLWAFWSWKKSLVVEEEPSGSEGGARR